MESTYEIPLSPPEAGQRYRDVEGRHWVVQAVCAMGGRRIADYYMLRMAFSAPGQREASLVMTKHEFLTLASRSGLRLVL